MKTNSEIYQLYLVTDRELMSTKTLEEAVEKAIDGGCTMVQLREKNLSSRDFYNTAKALKEFLQTRGRDVDSRIRDVENFCKVQWIFSTALFL